MLTQSRRRAADPSNRTGIDRMKSEADRERPTAAPIRTSAGCMADSLHEEKLNSPIFVALSKDFVLGGFCDSLEIQNVSSRAPFQLLFFT